MKTLRFGIEVETVGQGREVLARAIQSVVGGTISTDYRNHWVIDTRGRTWAVVPDGSLSSYDRSGEIVSPVLEYADIEEVQRVVRAVRAAGGRVDHTCSVHGHVDGSRFDAKSLSNLSKLVFRQERHIHAALGVSESRLARYCKPMDEAFIQRLEARPPKTVEEMNEAWYGYRNSSPSRYHESRYRGLNLNSWFFRKSIEFRFYDGSLHAGEVKAYIQFALALAAKALASKTASSKRREFNPATTKYDFRCFLVNGLGLVGDEFSTLRHHLTKRLAGSAAWKGERRDRRPAPEGAEVVVATPPAEVASAAAELAA
jgi:hypothetical protein